jgi:hypothetical protein
MNKDIYIPQPKGIKLGLVQVEENIWDMYLINENDDNLRNLLVVTCARGLDARSSTLRYFLEELTAKSFIKFETIYGEVIELENITSLTYYIGMDIFEKEFAFLIPVLELEPLCSLPLVKMDGYVVE